jgi:hypothetical protein
MVQHPIAKYTGEQHQLHGGRLHWPGVNGIPFRGPTVPDLKQAEYDSVPVVAQGCFGTFNLSKKEDAEVYQWIRDRIRNGWFTLDWVERHWDEASKTMWIYIEWSQLYAQAMKSEIRSLGHGSPTSFSLHSPG